MKSFLELSEEKEKHAVMTFGRMNPPTTGHMKVINKTKEVAKDVGGEHHVIVSHSQDNKKNPLSAEQKVKHLKRYSPDTNISSSSKEHPSIFHQASELHEKGVTHLHVVVGSDRVKEFHDSLNKYNGVKGAHGHYKFKKITVHSAGQRDPDAEGTEGMSGTKMREHAKNNNVAEFKKGVPAHVSDKHVKELMHDTRKGMGIHENVYHGLFKAIFVTGGPGSGKDIIIREAINESEITELNIIQARNYLADKRKLSEKSNDFRRESIRNRGPLIINGPADNSDSIVYVKEELEELGYETMMIFVTTSNRASQERNSLLSRTMTESIRYDRWLQSQKNTETYTRLFNNFIPFDNSDNLDQKEQDIHDIYENTVEFLESKVVNEFAKNWLYKNGNISFDEKIRLIIKEQKYDKKNPKFTFNSSAEKAKGPADITPDNSGNIAGSGTNDSIKGNVGPRKKTGDNSTVTGGAGHAAYESAPTIKIKPEPKEKNFSQDNNTKKTKRFGDKSLSASRIGKPVGIGDTYDTRAGGQGAAAGAGLGNQTYSESVQPNASVDIAPSNTNGTTKLGTNLQPNPLAEKKPFGKFLKSIKREAIDQFGTDSGLGGALGGAGNKEGMDTYFDQNRIGATKTINKKKKQEK